MNIKKMCIPFILAALCTCTAPASIGANALSGYANNFDDAVVTNVGKDNYTVNNLQVRSENYIDGCFTAGIENAVFGKRTDDASLRFDFKSAEVTVTSDNEHPDWATSRMPISFDNEIAVKKGDKIHLSAEFADKYQKSGYVVSLNMKGELSGEQSPKYRYRQLYPTESSVWNKGNALVIKYGAWLYFVDTGSKIDGKMVSVNTWHRYDAVIDTCNENYGGVQTISYYYDGVLCNVGEFYPSYDESSKELVTSVGGIGIQISPTTKKSGNTYTCAEETLYIDNVTLNVSDVFNEPKIKVDGKPYNGGYTDESVVEILDADENMVAFTGENNKIFAAYYPDEFGNFSFDFGGSGENKRLFLWNKDTMRPYMKSLDFVAYNENRIFSQDFSASNQSDNFRIIKGDSVSLSDDAGIVSGACAKPSDDNAYCISNKQMTNADGNPKNLGVGLALDFLADIDIKDSAKLSFDFARKSGEATKNVYVSSDLGELRELVSIDCNGTVKVGGTVSKNIIINENQWYHFDLILNSSLLTNENTVDLYVNGKKIAQRIPIASGGSFAKKLRTITGVEFSYNLGKGIDNGVCEADGFYVDNVSLNVCEGCLPKICEYDLTSSDSIFNMITDSKSFTLDDYGQPVDDFISSLNGEIFKQASFVSENGEKKTTLASDGNGYLKIATADGYDIYYKLLVGTDEEVAKNISETVDRNPDVTDWYAYTPPDIDKVFSQNNILNAYDYNTAPAGSKGFVRTSGENFVFENSGERINFWGCNIQGAGCFPEHDRAEKIANMIASYGFNLVRFHQIYGRGNTIFGGTQDGTKLNDVQMEKFCYFLKCLRQRGIYYYIDLGRSPLESDNTDEYTKQLSGYTIVECFDETVQEIQRNYAKMLLTYVDPYTNERLCDNAALMGVQCINELYIYENPLERTFGYEGERSEENEVLFNHYYEMFNKLYDKWYRENYTISSYEVEKGCISTAELNGGLITLGTAKQQEESRPWSSTTRRESVIRFYTEFERNYFAKMQQMFDENNIKTLMTGSTLWNSMDVALLDANLDTSFVDTHMYWAHPSGFSLDTGVVLGNSYEQIASMLKDRTLGLVGYFSNRKPYGKPYTISEWNQCASSQYMAEGPLLMGAYSKYQNWNPMIFFFTAKGIENYEKVRIGDVFCMSENPITMGTMPAVAMMRKSINEAQIQSYTDYSESKYYNYTQHHPQSWRDGEWKKWETQWYNFDKITQRASEGLLAKTGISLREKPANDDISARLENAENSGIFTSDTGELVYNRNNYSFTVNTPKSKAVAGFFSGASLSVGDLAEFEFDNEFAVAYVNSTDDNNIESSERVLLTVVGKASNTDQVLSRDGTKIIKEGKYPILTEQITGTVRLKTNGKKTVYALDSSGVRKSRINSTYENGILTIPLSLNDKCMNYEIVSEP